MWRALLLWCFSVLSCQKLCMFVFGHALFFNPWENNNNDNNNTTYQDERNTTYRRISSTDNMFRCAHSTSPRQSFPCLPGPPLPVLPGPPRCTPSCDGPLEAMSLRTAPGVASRPSETRQRAAPRRFFLFVLLWRRRSFLCASYALAISGTCKLHQYALSCKQTS